MYVCRRQDNIPDLDSSSDVIDSQCGVSLGGQPGGGDGLYTCITFFTGSDHGGGMVSVILVVASVLALVIVYPSGSSSCS